jgi:hypothetical protein
MATVSKKPSSPPPKPSRGRGKEPERAGGVPILRAFDAVYRFLASL